MGAIVLGWVNMAYLLAGAAFSIPFGRLGDLFGRKRLFMSGVASFTLASVLIATAHSPMALVLFRALQGFGTSMIFATSMAILISVFAPDERGKVLGITTGAVYLGLSSGPFFGGIITEHFGWRFIFWVNLPVGLLLLGTIFILLKDDAPEERAPFDVLGSLILGPALFAAMVGFSLLPTYAGASLLALGILGIVAFVYWETKTQAPLIDIGLFRHNTVFAFSSLAALINYAATFAVSFLLSIYLQKIKSLSPQEAGFALVSQPFVQALFSPLAGRLSDKIDSRVVATAGMVATLVGLILLTLVGADTSMTFVLTCLIVLGLGFGLFSSPNTNAIMGSVDKRIYGVASAVVSTMRQVGMMFSMGLVMMVFAMYLGQAQVSSSNAPQFLHSMRVTFTACAVMCFIGIFASLARGRSRTRR